MVLLEQKRPPLFEEGLQRGGIEPIVSVQLASVEPPGSGLSSDIGPIGYFTPG